MRAWMVIDKRVQIAFGMIQIQHARRRITNDVRVHGILHRAYMELEEEYAKMSGVYGEIQRPRGSTENGM